ncbi:PUA-like domain-containing protein [Crassisporium funariophilum]|nr:PUA-like domain-containing protein [Crassisporium funariophilum]
MGLEDIRKRLMQDTSLYDPTLSGADPRYGAIAGCPVGTVFESRKACSAAGVHVANYAGISGNTASGAYSICMSGGYEDDKDEGELFIYTGTGGQEDAYSGTGKQVKDQTFEHRDNYALKKSVETQRPVRVIRGANSNSKWAPTRGYRYDGLYIVESAFLGKGKSGYSVCKYRLRRVPGQPPLPVKSAWQ